MRINRVSTTILLGVLTCTGISAYSADWLGNNADYNTASQWSTGAVPAATDNVSITSGTANYTSTANLGRNALTEISGTGSLVITNARYVGGGTLNVSAGGTLTHTGNYFLVGSSSRGTANQSGGTINTTVDRGFFLSDNAGQAGSAYNLTGGTLNVTSIGSTNDTVLFAVHFGKGGSGDKFTIDGGSATFTATPTGAGVRNVWFSRGSTFDLKSGSAAFSGYESFTIGRYKNGTTIGTSTLSMSGGNFSATQLSSFTLGGEENGLVTLTGGTMNIGSSITLGGAAGVTGTFTMSGGQLTAFDILAGTGTPLFNFDGGDLFLKSDRTGILNETWFNDIAGTTAVYSPVTDMTHIYVVPEPSTLSLMAIPLLLGAVRRKRSVC